MTEALLLGAGTALGLFLVVRGLVPSRLPLAVALERLVAPTAGTAPRRRIVEVAPDGLAARAGRPLARPLAGLPLLARRTRSDLVVLGRTPERHLAEKVALAIVGLVAVPALVGLCALAGLRVSWSLPLWLALVCAGLGFLAPDLGIHGEAERRRADFRHALGAFLDLVVVALAGGLGVEGALAESASIGHGWAFDQLHRSLAEAQLSRVAPWEPLRQLGSELGIDELTELAATVALAGTEGAKVRASLASKASSLRAHALARAQADAEAASERMSLPVVLLFAGFLLFVGFPAIAHVLGGI